MCFKDPRSDADLKDLFIKIRRHDSLSSLICELKNWQTEHLPVTHNSLRLPRHVSVSQGHSSVIYTVILEIRGPGRGNSGSIQLRESYLLLCGGLE